VDYINDRFEKEIREVMERTWNFRLIEKDLRSEVKKKGYQLVADTRLITPYGINACKHIPFKQRIRTV